MQSEGAARSRYEAIAALLQLKADAASLDMGNIARAHALPVPVEQAPRVTP